VFFIAAPSPHRSIFLRLSAKHLSERLLTTLSYWKQCSYAHLPTLSKYQIRHTMTTGKMPVPRRRRDGRLDGARAGGPLLRPCSNCEEDVDMSQHRADSPGSLMTEGRWGSWAVNARRVRKSLPARKNHHQLERLLPECPIKDHHYGGVITQTCVHTYRSPFKHAFSSQGRDVVDERWEYRRMEGKGTVCCRLQGTSTPNNSTIIISSCTCASISRKADLPTQQESEKERAAHATENRTPEAVDDGPGIECPRGQHLFNHIDNKERKTHMVTQVSDR